MIDPAKVVRTALQDAASVAGLLITSEVMIADKPEPKGQAGGGIPGGMGEHGRHDVIRRKARRRAQERQALSLLCQCRPR